MPQFFHHKLLVYQKALAFILSSDHVVAGWPRERLYLVIQFRKAASSIALNIAEASHEIATADRRRIFRYARRSAGECVAVFDIAVGFKLMTECDAAPYYDQLNEIIAMLTSITKPKRTSITKPKRKK
ncbi:MAG: four helix bundle protein [Gemmatimonadota bacterium]